jgi:hypothetical protein
MSKRAASDDGGGGAVKKMRRIADDSSSTSDNEGEKSDILKGGLTPACADVLNKLCDHKHAKPFLQPINEVMSLFMCPFPLSKTPLQGRAP